MWWPSESEAASWGPSSSTRPSGRQSSTLAALRALTSLPQCRCHAGAWQLRFTGFVDGSLDVPTPMWQQVCMQLHAWGGW